MFENSPPRAWNSPEKCSTSTKCGDLTLFGEIIGEKIKSSSFCILESQNHIFDCRSNVFQSIPVWQGEETKKSSKINEKIALRFATVNLFLLTTIRIKPTIR